MVIIIVGMIGVGKIIFIVKIVEYLNMKVFFEFVGENFVFFFYYKDFKQYGFLL